MLSGNKFIFRSARTATVRCFCKTKDCDCLSLSLCRFSRRFVPAQGQLVASTLLSPSLSFSLSLSCLISLTLVKRTQNYSSQQHPDLEDSIGRPCSIFTLLAGSVAPLDGGPTLSLISAAIVIKACSTFIAFFAEVSKNGIPS